MLSYIFSSKVWKNTWPSNVAMQLLQLHVAVLGHAWMASSALNSPFMHVALTACCYGDVNLGWEHIYLKKSLAELLRFSEHLLFLDAVMQSNDELPFLWENLVSYTGKGNVRCLSHRRTFPLAQFHDIQESSLTEHHCFRLIHCFYIPQADYKP